MPLGPLFVVGEQRHHCAEPALEPRRLLIVHEQHLQPMGCDVRLLGVIRGLLSADLEVSLFFRTHTPIAKRSPSSPELATLLRIPRGYQEEWLRRDVRTLPPPAIYEHSGSAQLGRLFARGWFHAVLVFFWFWHDPKPNVAEMVLPALHAYAPEGRRPFVAVLSDDAHSIRDMRLSAFETDPELSANYSRRASAHAQRESVAYSFADMVLHITAADSAAERAAFPTIHHSGLLRLSLGGGAAASGGGSSSNSNHSGGGSGAGANGAAPGSRRDSSRPQRMLDSGRRGRPEGSMPLVMHVGFLGNGATPTNHLAVQWFLRSCWSALRTRQPTVRLRLLGLRPGFRVSADGVERPACNATHDAHCGWASGTPYHGVEVANGIDELGFVSDEAMALELSHWSAMVVPVLVTTGINTKVLTALRRPPLPLDRPTPPPPLPFHLSFALLSPPPTLPSTPLHTCLPPAAAPPAAPPPAAPPRSSQRCAWGCRS